MNIPDGPAIQIDNGDFTRIHNAILSKLAQMPLSGTQFRCVMFLFRKTYGFNQKQDRISLSQWADGTGMKRQNVWAVLQTLIAAKVVFCESDGPKRAMTWGFNKYHGQWQMPENEESVMPQHDSSVDESVIEEHDSLQPPVMPQHDKSVMPQHEYKRKERQEAAAPTFSVPESPPKRDPFLVAYESTWGRVPASEYEAELIADWAKRVTLDGWTYGLKESVKNHATNFRYLEKILLRIEREGYEPADAPPSTAPAQVAYSLEDLCLT